MNSALNNGSYWRSASGLTHKVLEVRANQVVSWSMETKPDGEGETFMGPAVKFRQQFRKVGNSDADQ